MAEKRYLRVEEFCKEYDVGRNQAYEQIKQGQIPSIRIGKSIRIPKDALAEWERRQLQQATGQAS